jgi:hypothetical protein
MQTTRGSGLSLSGSRIPFNLVWRLGVLVHVILRLCVWKGEAGEVRFGDKE